MSRPPPTSVLLPTVRYVDVVDQVAAQLGDDDELLVICDADDDPVAAAAEAGDLPDGARLVVAGEPDRCSGKANAIAAGMEAAEHERIVWTDDDFHHPSDWLSTLQADYERHGPVSELPFFRGRDPLSVLVEPAYVLNGTLGVFATGTVWGGAVVFERGDLETPSEIRAELLDDEHGGAAAGLDDRDGDPDEIDAEAAFLTALRRTVSDDGLLSEFLDVSPVRRTRTVDVGGSLRETLERHVRFLEIVEEHAPIDPRAQKLCSLIGAALCLLFPLHALVVSTLATGAVYAWFGIRRWTFLLTYPALLATIVLALYATVRQTFVWGGRRYRWRSKFDVEILP